MSTCEKVRFALGTGLVYDALGDKNKALAFLQKAVDLHASWVVMLRADARLHGLRAEPRIKELEERIRPPPPFHS